jgi:hypothetical protein
MIRRGKHSIKFVILPNSMLEDGRLSAASKGTLAYLLSRPRDWEVRHETLRRTMKLGRQGFATVMQNLIETGYARRSEKQQRADDNSFLGYDYEIFDKPEPVDTRGPVVPFAASESRQRKGDSDNKKEETKYSNTKFPLHLNASTAVGDSSEGYRNEKTHKKSIGGDRGRIELEIANRIGPDGFEVLMALPASAVDQLCAMQRRGCLDQSELDDARERLRHQTSNTS